METYCQDSELANVDIGVQGCFGDYSMAPGVFHANRVLRRETSIAKMPSVSTNSADHWLASINCSARILTSSSAVRIALKKNSRELLFQKCRAVADSTSSRTAYVDEAEDCCGR